MTVQRKGKTPNWRVDDVDGRARLCRKRKRRVKRIP